MRLLFALALALATACSGGGPTEAPSPAGGPGAPSVISVYNATNRAVAYLAVGEGSLALILVKPSLSRDEYESRSVAAGATAPVTDIIGYDPRLGVNFYLYVVDESAGEAHFSRTLLVTADELRRRQGLVTLTRNQF